VTDVPHYSVLAYPRDEMPCPTVIEWFSLNFSLRPSRSSSRVGFRSGSACAALRDTAILPLVIASRNMFGDCMCRTHDAVPLRRG
jgi:hypothetical protein